MTTNWLSLWLVRIRKLSLQLFCFFSHCSIYFLFLCFCFFLSLLAAFFLCPFTLQTQVQIVASINSHLGALGKGPLADFLPANKDKMQGGRGYTARGHTVSPDSEGKEKKKKVRGAGRNWTCSHPWSIIPELGHRSESQGPRQRRCQTPRKATDLVGAAGCFLSQPAGLFTPFLFFFLSWAPRHGEAWQHSRVTDTKTHTRTHMVTKTPTVVMLGKAPSVGRALVTMATTTSLESHWWWWSVWCVFSSFILF